MKGKCDLSLNVYIGYLTCNLIKTSENYKQRRIVHLFTTNYDNVEVGLTVTREVKTEIATQSWVVSTGKFRKGQKQAKMKITKVIIKYIS